MTFSLTSLHVYPIKSCAGVSVGRWRLDGLGLAHDRRWMLVDAEGRAVTQREWPVLSRARVTMDDGLIVVAAGRQPVLQLPLEPDGGERLDLTLWGWKGTGLAASPAGDEWFSRLLGTPVRLLYCPPGEGQPVNPQYSREPSRAAFSDGYPLLLIGQASLDDLNRRLTPPMPMNRFRPNLVVGGASPYAEDGWREIRTGEVRMTVVKGCDRCAFTTIDQETGERGVEPLRTLSTFRKRDGKVWFGQNVVHRDAGTLTVGDPVIPERG